MFTLFVPRVLIDDPLDAAETDKALAALPRQAIDQLPWKAAYPYQPSVSFVMGYSDTHLFLQYFVEERAIRAVNNQVNGRVWEDSCVEFFIAFDEAAYYNLEFNCIGTAKIGYGPAKSERNSLPAPIVQQVITRAHILRKPGGQRVHWTLFVAVPLATFLHHQPLKLAGHRCRGNFYKCGDLLPDPHFITWATINTPTPNFHVPASFGELRFE